MRNNLFRRLMTLLLTAVMVLGIVSGSGIEKVSAATAKPGKAKISAKVNDDGTSVTITIDKTANAQGYKILVEKPEGDGFVKLATLKKDGSEVRTYTAKNLAPGEYSFMVRSYLKSGKKTVWGKYSKTVTVTVKGGDDTEGGIEKINVGYITDELTVIETKYFVFEIDPNIYVCPNLAEKADGIFSAMENASGRSIKDAKYHTGKIRVYVSRDSKADPLYESQGHLGSSEGRMWIAPSDLFVADGYTFTGFLANVFCREFSGCYMGYFLGGGFRCYTHLKTLEYLLDNDPDLAAVAGDIYNLNNNFELKYSMAYQQSVEYWIGHYDETFDISSNGVSSLAYRFMGYLDKKFGEYNSWIETYNKLAFAKAKAEGLHIPDELSTEQINDITVQAIQKTYGKRVFNNFYSWMKKNEYGRFDVGNYWNSANDLSKAAEYTIYPYFTQFNNYTKIGHLDITEYNNLTVNIAPAEFYLREYKGEDTSNLILHVSEGTTVELYDYDLNLIDTADTTEIPLKGVAAVKLVGSGKTEFSITGYNIYKSW
ncbi:MAG: hypothetical protein II694_03670 [Lachnospiraceae bacterium]|nr:hypothetical protein [Lachnospiraceae bacterium]